MNDIAFRAPLALFAILAVAFSGCMDVSSKSSINAAGVSRATPSVSGTPVNQATSGLRYHVRWVMPPDSSAILVVVDPVGRVDSVPFDEDAHPMSCAARRYQSTR